MNKSRKARKREQREATRRYLERSDAADRQRKMFPTAHHVLRAIEHRQHIVREYDRWDKWLVNATKRIEPGKPGAWVFAPGFVGRHIEPEKLMPEIIRRRRKLDRGLTHYLAAKRYLGPKPAPWCARPYALILARHSPLNATGEDLRLLAEDIGLEVQR